MKESLVTDGARDMPEKTGAGREPGLGLGRVQLALTLDQALLRPFITGLISASI